jgi:glutathione synthase
MAPDADVALTRRFFLSFGEQPDENENVMRIGFVVRSVYSQHLTYTTTHLAYEAYRRGHEVHYTTVNGFHYSEDRGLRATTLSIPRGLFQSRAAFLHAIQSEAAIRQEVTLSDFDAVFLRYNPNESDSEKRRPVNPAIEFGRILKNAGVFVVNDPDGLAKASSKMYLAEFPARIRARTLVTRSTVKIKEFLNDLGRPAILKPLAGFGGQDVFFVKAASREVNINQIIAAITKNGYLMVQEYLPEVRQGDKRLLLLNGEPIRVERQTAMYRRVAPKGDVRSNIHVGGLRKTAEFGRDEARIAAKIGPKLAKDGLWFVGVDILGDKLLEINVFCPGGINNINELYDINVGQRVIEELERQVLTRKHARRTSPSLPNATSASEPKRFS